jgi:hypothetical protein
MVVLCLYSQNKREGPRPGWGVGLRKSPTTGSGRLNVELDRRHQFFYWSSFATLELRVSVTYLSFSLHFLVALMCPFRTLALWSMLLSCLSSSSHSQAPLSPDVSHVCICCVPNLKERCCQKKTLKERAHEHLCYLLIDQGSFGTPSKINSNSLASIYLILAK